MKIAMANDHAGTKLKNEIKAYLESQGHEVKDFGTYDEEGWKVATFQISCILPRLQWRRANVNAEFSLTA